MLSSASGFPVLTFPSVLLIQTGQSNCMVYVIIMPPLELPSIIRYHVEESSEPSAEAESLLMPIYPTAPRKTPIAAATKKLPKSFYADFHFISPSYMAFLIVLSFITY